MFLELKKCESIRISCVLMFKHLSASVLEEK